MGRTRGYGLFMRITGGALRGRTLPAKVQQGVRPTSSRVREALFSIIGHDLSGVCVLDAFGGSGLLGFEAISRGASVTTVERHRAAAQAIRSNASHLGVSIDLRIADVRSVLAAGDWDVILMDPPYGDDPVEWVAEASAAVGTLLVIEHRTGVLMPVTVGPLSLERSKRYGGTSLSAYRRGADAGLDESSVVP